MMKTISASDDQFRLFEMALTWLKEGHAVALATVTDTWGSAPRPAGSHLIVRSDGLFEGSVSGGCVEGAVIVEAQQCLTANSKKEISFGVSDAQAWQAGLGCGGNISVFIQPMNTDFFSPQLVSDILEMTRDGAAISIGIDRDTGKATKVDQAENASSVYLSYAPKFRLAIIGAVHIAQYLAPMAAQLGYDVLVIDPRSMFANGERMQGLTIVTKWPDDALSVWKTDASSAIATLSHDPKLDDPALVAALKSSAFYIAALGSKKTHASRVERLIAQGFSSADIARIHAPAGLAIGAKSPAEIAVSILAELTAARRKKQQLA
jgi:xanthine dehydrogenase accessory factor